MKLFVNFMLILVAMGWLILPASAQEISPSRNHDFQEQHVWLEVDDVQNAILSPDGNYVAVRTSTYLLVYDIRPNQTAPTLVIEQAGEGGWFDRAALAFSPNDRWVAASFNVDNVTKTVRVWDIASGEIVVEVTDEFYELNELAFSPTDPILLIARHYGPDPWMGQLSLLDVEKGEIVREITNPNGYIHILSISPDGEWVFIEETNGTSDRTWTINLHTPTANLIQIGCPCYVSPSWEYVLLTSHFGDTYIETLPEGGENAMTEELEVFGGFRWNHDGTLVTRLDEQGRVRVWDIQNNAQWTVGVGLDGSETIRYLFHPFQNMMAITRPQNSIELWDVDSSTLLTNLSGYAGTIYEWSFSPDGRRLVVVTNLNMASVDVVYVWELDSGALVYSTLTDYVRDLALNADGTVLVGFPSWSVNAPSILQVWRLPQE